MTITDADEGKTFNVGVGTAVNLELATGSGMQPWVVEPPNAAVLALAAAPPAPAGTVTQGYRAVAAGTARIMATERPTCNPGQVCPKFIRAFQATVIVA